MLKIDIFTKKKVDYFTVFASLPDMGGVGGLVSSFLANNLETTHIASIVSNNKPWVTVQEGIIKGIKDIYKIYFSDKERLLIFTGDAQPGDHRELFELCNIFLDFCSSIGKVNRLYTAGGSLNELLTGEPPVLGVTTKPELKEVLDRSNIHIMRSEFSTITWFNGLILGLASERKIEGIGLYGEISDRSIPQPLAAKSIMKAFAKIEYLSVSTRPFDRQYEEVLDHIEKNKGAKNLNRGTD